MSATAWAWKRWYVIELDVKATTLVGRLLDDHDEAMVRASL